MKSGFNDGLAKPITQDFLDISSTLIKRNPAGITSPLFKINTIADFKNQVKPIEWLVEGFLESNTLSLLFGEPGCGKSFIGVDLACCVATGTNWHGKPVTAPGGVVYIAGEGFNGLTRRFAAWGQHNGINASSSFATSNRAADLYDSAGAMAVADELAELNMNPVLIIVDTLARNFGVGDENSTSDMSAFVNNIDIHLRHRFNCCVLLVHHTGHGAKDRGRGSSVLKGALDAEYKVEKKDNHVLINNTKMKDAEPMETIGFKIQPIVIGDFDDGYSSAVLVLDELQDFKEDEAMSFGKNQRRVIHEINEAEEWGTELHRDDLNELLKEPIPDKNNRRKTVKGLLNKGTITEENGILKVVKIAPGGG